MLFAILLLLQHTINRLEKLFHQQLVSAQNRMEHRQSLRMGLGNALFHTHRGNLHDQLGLALLIGQVEIAAQHLIDDKRPVQLVSSGDGSSRHQVILFVGDGNRLGQVVSLCIGIERTSLWVEAYLRIGTHVNRSVQSRLQKLDVEPKLILISPSRRIVYIKVELLDALIALRQTTIKQFPSTNYLHTLT